jgi:hypothetical protein
MSSHSNNQELKQRARVKQLPRVDTQHQSTEVSRAARANVCSGSWSCKNALPRKVGEKPGPVRSQATIAATSGLVPTMFMTRVML